MRTKKTQILTAATAFTLLVIALNVLFPLPLDKLSQRSSTVVTDRDGNLLRAFLAPDEMWRLRTPLAEISPDLRKAVLEFEDRFFYWHPGINPVSVLRAALSNLRAGKVVRGGSTITLQIARMMEPKERTFRNKIIEALRALQLEWRFSKDEILELYLNMAPYGGNIVGIGAAARFYFGKPPRQLSPGQAALLAALPNSPNRFRPDLNPQEARNARRRVLDILQARGAISPTEHLEAGSEAIPFKRFQLPFVAPHLAVQLMAEHTGQERIVSTIDLGRQQLARDMLANHLRPLQRLGIHNGAVVILDNKKRELLAMVGSGDFHDDQHQGQVNGATAARSPGSALKPFIYGLGLEHGLISPQTLIPDLPVDYAGYQPSNFDGMFHGTVSAEQALVRSLNVPAVNLYRQLGENGIFNFLKQAGTKSISQPKEHYGLSLILGGCEITLLELTNLYASLACGGQFEEVKMTEHNFVEPARRILDEGSTFILTEILSKVRRPELPAVWDASVNLPKVAWKTGTSYGNRDAWSVGYTPDFTVGVWIGNFNAKGVPALVGAEVAAPLLFAIIDALAGKARSRWFQMPEKVEERRVCTVSGMTPGPFCTTSTQELHLPGISPTRPCSVHRQILVDRQSGKRLCSSCRLGRTWRTRIVEDWPPEISAWFSRHGRPLDFIPSHFEDCSRIAAGDGPIINSPQDGAVYRIRAGVDPRYQQILLDAAVSNLTGTIYWFVDGRLIYSGPPDGRVFLTPEPGTHNLICMDDEGRSSNQKIVVRSDKKLTDLWN